MAAVDHLPHGPPGEDYAALFQRIAQTGLEAHRYGPTAKRHLRMAILQLAAANYVEAAKAARRSLQAGHALDEALHVLGLALLGQAMVEARLLPPGPGAIVPPMVGVRPLMMQALQAFTTCAMRNPRDAESRDLALCVAAALAEPGETDPDGPPP